MLIYKASFWKHIILFTNLEFVRENSIFHLFPNVDRFSKNILILKDWTLSKNTFKRLKISRWLGLEKEENVARTRNFCGWPFFPPAVDLF